MATVYTVLACNMSHSKSTVTQGETKIDFQKFVTPVRGDAEMSSTYKMFISLCVARMVF